MSPIKECSSVFLACSQRGATTASREHVPAPRRRPPLSARTPHSPSPALGNQSPTLPLHGSAHRGQFASPDECRPCSCPASFTPRVLTAHPWSPRQYLPPSYAEGYFIARMDTSVLSIHQLRPSGLFPSGGSFFFKIFVYF